MWTLCILKGFFSSSVILAINWNLKADTAIPTCTDRSALVMGVFANVAVSIKSV